MALRQDRVLGALLGMGIGDALGMPVQGWTREHVAERYGRIDRYHSKTFDDGAELAAGEFTDDSEGALCIIESFTAATGEIDPENILARLAILARGEGRRWMTPSTYEAIMAGEDGKTAGHRVTGDVAVRGIPLGLIAAGRPAVQEAFIEETARLLAGMTHGDPLAWQSVALVAEGMRLTASCAAECSQLPVLLRQTPWSAEFESGLQMIEERAGSGIAYDEFASDLGFGDDVTPVVLSALAAAATAADLESGVFAAATMGGAADSRGAIAGALLGGEYGTAGIPQSLIDGLEGRMYIMLAAPWFHQTIQLKSSFWRSGD
ncbi:MAG: ADP-ribosylglycohydrolase family protein [Thermomicrobiales bacterium]|nr:ADP-ribosylglycohydrolase family protein [Thermomicrobiales bacterium]